MPSARPSPGYATNIPGEDGPHRQHDGLGAIPANGTHRHRRRSGRGFNDWYNTNYIPGYLTVPGCVRARRYLAVEGQPKYLTVYEFENPGVPDTPEWARARSGDLWNARIRPNVRLDEGSPAVFRRIYPA
jgi:hypothetical protein